MKPILKKLKKYIDLPIEEGKIYKTKFQTDESFLVKRIVWTEKKTPSGFILKSIAKIEGVYSHSPYLGICPINEDRLIHETKEGSEVTVCPKCGTEINALHSIASIL